MSYSKLKSLVANVEAIATAMKVRIDDRQTTDEERYYPIFRFQGLKILNIGTDIPSAMMAEPIRKAAGLDRRISLL